MFKQATSFKNQSQNKNTKKFSISVEDFKKKTHGGFTFYEYVMLQKGVRIKWNNNFKLHNPFYEDKNPGMSVNCKDNEYFFCDHGDRKYEGDVIDFAGFYYGLDPKKDLDKILQKACNDLGITDYDISSDESKKDIQSTETIKHEQKELTCKAKVKINKNDYDFCEFRAIDNDDMSFWGKYGISYEILLKYDVKAIGNIGRLDNKGKEIIIYKYDKSDPMYAYRADDRAFQAYRPLNKKYKFRWYSKKPEKFIFGYKQLPKEGEKIFITGGQKDVLSLGSHGFDTVTLNSETANLPEWLIKDLRNRFNNIIILYDIDDTGLKNSSSLSKEHNLIRVVLPDLLKEFGKDISDYFMAVESDFNSDLISMEKLNSLINNAITEFSSEMSNSMPVRTANQRMADARNQPEIKMLLGPIWMTGELHLLFADTGLGKSAWSVQISDAVSKGKDVLMLKNENSIMTVLHYDFELSDKQFWKRYVGVNNREYRFSNNLYLDSIDIPALFAKADKNNYEELLFGRITSDIDKIKPGVLVIDNLTYLDSQTTSDVQIAQNVMRQLCELKKRYEISILVIAHTVKTQANTPISLNDMAGSKTLSNFADSVSAIGRSSKDPEIRYIKQLKPSRSTEIVYAHNNVIVCSLCDDIGFLGLEFIEMGAEKDHLRKDGKIKIPELLPEVVELRNKGYTCRQIADELGIGSGTVTKWEKKFPEYFASASIVSIEGRAWKHGSTEASGKLN
jgi:hypothetical protein